MGTGPSGFMGGSETDASSIHGRSLSRSVAVGLEMRMPPHSAAPMALVGSFITQGKPVLDFLSYAPHVLLVVTYH